MGYAFLAQLHAHHGADQFALRLPDFLFIASSASCGGEDFQTGWFVESLATQVLVIFIIWTSLNPFKSHPHPILLLTSIVVVCLAVALPLLPWSAYVGFVPLPSWFYGVLALLVLCYLVIVQIVKVVLYRMERNKLSNQGLRPSWRTT